MEKGLKEIDAMDQWEGRRLNTAKEILAYELTKLVHGEEEAKKAKEASRALFKGQGSQKKCGAGRASIDGEQVKDVKKTFGKDAFSGDGMVVKRGKKNFMKVTL